MNDSEEWRRECEARYVLHNMDSDQREAFYIAASKIRGKARIIQLIEDVNNLKKKARETMK